MMRKYVLFLLLLVPLLLAACQNSPQGTQPPETPTPAVQEVSAEDMAAEGLEIFRAVGCAACHGQNGEGNIGPALAGHTREQVFRQVRTPKGDIMPAFSPEELSDEDLEKIVAWIDSLGEEMVMEHSEAETSPELSMTENGHLRLILDALAAESQADAVHHAQHLVEDASPEVKELAEKLLADLQAGKAHDVEAEVGEVLGDAAQEDFDVVSVHLGMSLAAAQREDDADVEHHLQSAVEAAASHNHYAEMQKLLEDWQAGDKRHDVVDRLYAALELDHQD